MARQAPVIPSKSFFGSGLSAAVYLSILGLSVGLFLFWGGPLWSVSTGADHVMRFAVSYLAVLPALAIVLLVIRGWSWTRLLTGTGNIWAFKMLLTSSLYLVVAPGTTSGYDPVVAAAAGAHTDSLTTRVRRAAAARARRYRAAAGDFPAGTVRGKVLAPAGGAGPSEASATGREGSVVWIERPGPGLRLADPADLEIRITAAGYDRPAYLVRRRDHVKASGEGPGLHTLHITHRGGGGSIRPDVANLPLPSSAGARRVKVPPPGAYDLRCDNHPGERAVLVSVDHPYAAITGPGGGFVLSRVPAGRWQVRAIMAGEGMAASEAAREVRVEPGASTEITLIAGRPRGDELDIKEARAR